AELAPDGNPSPPRPPRPPSIAPTDDVHHSVVMRAIDAASILDEPASRTSQLTAPPSRAPRRPPAPPSGTPIGIDLGVSHTTVTALIGSRIAVLAPPGAPRHIPSVVHIEED